MKTLTESMTYHADPYYTIRVWRQEPEDKRFDNADLKEQMRKLSESRANIAYVANQLLQIDRVNAVEVLSTETKNGLVVYKDWP